MKNARRVWVASTLGLGAVAATTGVAMASVYSEGGPGQEGPGAVAPPARPPAFGARNPGSPPGFPGNGGRPKLCVRLDPAVQKALTDAIEAGKGKTIELPLMRGVLTPCSSTGRPPFGANPTGTSPAQPTETSPTDPTATDSTDPSTTDPDDPSATDPTDATPVATPAPVAPTTTAPKPPEPPVQEPNVRSAGS